MTTKTRQPSQPSQPSQQAEPLGQQAEPLGPQDEETIFYYDLLTAAAVAEGRARALVPDAAYAAGRAPLHERSLRQRWWRMRRRRNRGAFSAAWARLDDATQAILRRDGLYSARAQDADGEGGGDGGDGERLAPTPPASIQLIAVPCGWTERGFPGIVVSHDRLALYLDARHHGWTPTLEQPLPRATDDRGNGSAGSRQTSHVTPSGSTPIFGISRALPAPKAARTRPKAKRA